MPLAAGDRIGPYEILAPLGAGGMGEVYRARDSKLKRDVAVKVLPSAFAGDAARMMRFQREAEVLASLNHPNIAHIYGVEDRALVMELAEGESPRGPLDWDAAWKIASQIAEALAYAHEKGVIHRDLKPANIKVTPDGVVKLLDFGLAKAFSGAPDSAALNPENSPTITMGATVAGVVLGTAAYMSPEQARGKNVDRRADIWAFGVVLYELLTGKRLFHGDLTETLASVIKDQPDFSAAPQQAQPILKACLEKDPRKRLQAIGDLQYLTGSPSAQASRTRPKSAMWGWAAAAVLAIALGAVSLIHFREAPPRLFQFEIHAPPGSRLPLGTPSISRDGSTIAFTAVDADGVTRIYVRPIDRVEARVLSGTEGATHPFWSPDGQSLAFVSTTAALELKRVNVNGGGVRDLAPVTGPWHGDWNAKGDILFESHASTLRISAEGGPATAAVDGGFPFFLPDGKRFLYSASEDASGKPSIRLATLGSTQSSLVLGDTNAAPVVAPTPNGKTYLLFLREVDLMAQEFDERSAAVKGNAVVLLHNVARVASPPRRAAVGVSPAGILAYQAGSNTQTGQLTWLDRSGKPVASLPAEASGSDPTISPNGSMVALRRTDAAGDTNLWITDLARKSSSRLTYGRSDSRPVWSPDGKQIAYTAREGKLSVHIVNLDGSGQTRVLKDARFAESWSPDSNHLLSSGAGGVLLTALDGDQKTIQVGAKNGLSADGQFSPDGKFIAFSSNESGRFDVYVQPMPPAPGQWKVSIDGGGSPRWSHDGKEIFFVVRQGDMMAVDVKSEQPFSVGVPHLLFSGKELDLGGNYNVRGDGRQFLTFVSPQQTDSNIVVLMNWWLQLGGQNR